MGYPPDPDPSAVVILRDPDGRIFLVERPSSASFFPGFHAFPGGGVEPEDRLEAGQAPPGEPTTEADEALNEDPDGGPEEIPNGLAVLQACAARELAEEVQVEVDPAVLEPAGVVVTPPFSPIRYRTQFFLAEIEPDVQPDPQRPELAGGTWMHPAEAVDRWELGELKLPPPVIHTLELLAGQGPSALTARGTSVDTFPITFLPGLRVEPLQTSTLPPHTHTNAFIVGEERMAIVDPGASRPELDSLLEALEALDAGEDELAYVALTHHHGDHVAGAGELLDAFGAELACSPQTAKRTDLEADILLEEGDRLDLGEHELVAYETPGHAVGHLVFHLPGARTLLPGDLIAGIGTVLVEPEEGDMAAYMDSLERIGRLCEKEGIRLAFPAHGPPVFGPARAFKDTLSHRREREDRVAEALEAGARSLEQIATAAYEDKPDAPRPLKRMSTRAHLDKLEAEGRAKRAEDGWHPA